MCHAFKFFICSKWNLKLWKYKSMDGGEAIFTHHVSPAQICGGQRPRLVFVSAPRTQLCIPSHDTRAWCGLPGSGNCCGRVSLTLTGLKGRPESTPPKQNGEKRKEKSVRCLKQQNWKQIFCHIRGVWIETRCTQRSLTVEPHGNSFFQGVKFSVQTISRGRVA